MCDRLRGSCSSPSSSTGVDGEVVGACDVMAESFPQLRQFTTGSWLGRAFQGRGLGKEFRQAALALGFEGFGADFALTAMWHDNAASKGVTTSLGYEYEGRRPALRRGVADEQLGYRMARGLTEVRPRCCERLATGRAHRASRRVRPAADGNL